jgi:archaellum biogenesis ATPase FlaH
MKTIKIKDEWLKRLLPEGFPYPSSTLISGPGGTGKPLVEFAFIASWLRYGGSVVSIPLQYPTMEFVRTAMNKLYSVNLEDYPGKTAYIKFDPHIEKYEKSEDNVLKANLLKPDIWNKAIEIVEGMVEKSDLGTLVFGSALNLLLFSPTYKEGTIKNIEEILKNDKSKTYIFSVSTSAFADKIKIWEDAVDNLMFTRMEESMNLFLKILKMRGVSFSDEEVRVPISREMFDDIKDVAEATRKRIIPAITKI